jgi:hypothetical protein
MKTKREFKTGANRNPSDGKFVYSKFINPLNEYSFAKYMHGKRKLEDGTYREGDNWQKGIPKDSLMDSLIRHTKELELLHQGYTLVHWRDDEGEHTEVFNNLWDATDFANWKKAIVVSKEDILNAIRFNSEGYKLQLLNTIDSVVKDNKQKFGTEYNPKDVAFNHKDGDIIYLYDDEDKYEYHDGIFYPLDSPKLAKIRDIDVFIKEMNKLSRH